jgi:hypothetical protein
MALQTSGQISLNDVNVELDNSGTAQIGMGDTAVRDLFDIPSGEIEMADGYGKSSQILPTQTYTADSDSFQSVQPNNSSTTYDLSLTFSGWTPQSGDLLVVAGWGQAHVGQQPHSNMTNIYNNYGPVWDSQGYGFRNSYAISYRICTGSESNTINVVTGGAFQSLRSNLPQYNIYNIGGHSVMSGAVFRYGSAITGVSTRNTTNTWPREMDAAASVTRVIDNSSVNQPHIIVCDSGATLSATYSNAPSNYFSSMTNAFEVDRGGGYGSPSNNYGSTVFRPSNGNESITWTSFPSAGGSDGVRCGRFSTTLLLSF